MSQTKKSNINQIGEALHTKSAILFRISQLALWILKFTLRHKFIALVTALIIGFALYFAIFTYGNEPLRYILISVSVLTALAYLTIATATFIINRLTHYATTQQNRFDQLLKTIECVETSRATPSIDNKINSLQTKIYEVESTIEEHRFLLSDIRSDIIEMYANAKHEGRNSQTIQKKK